MTVSIVRDISSSLVGVANPWKLSGEDGILVCFSRLCISSPLKSLKANTQGSHMTNWPFDPWTSRPCLRREDKILKFLSQCGHCQSCCNVRSHLWYPGETNSLHLWHFWGWMTSTFLRIVVVIGGDLVGLLTTIILWGFEFPAKLTEMVGFMGVVDSDELFLWGECSLSWWASLWAELTKTCNLEKKDSHSK